MPSVFLAWQTYVKPELSMNLIKQPYITCMWHKVYDVSCHDCAIWQYRSFMSGTSTLHMDQVYKLLETAVSEVLSIFNCITKRTKVSTLQSEIFMFNDTTEFCEY